MLRRVYGAPATHLLACLGCLALGGYVVLTVSSDPTATTMAWWFAGAVVLADFVLLPLAALADRALPRGSRPGAVNYFRVPALASALLLLLFFPGILEQGRDTLLAASGHAHQPYLTRWLLLTAGFCATSGLLYLLRRVKGRR